RGGQQQDPHDALAIHGSPVAADANMGGVAGCRVHELGGSAGVQPEAITNHAFARHHAFFAGASDAAGASGAPPSKSDATQIAFLPCSRSVRATSVSAAPSFRLAALINIGRFTPVTTSILSGSRKVMPRFDGVPPNMSVAISTPPGCFTLTMAAAMSSRASWTSSCQPIETAAK